jgi:hypothetical protein
VRAPIDGAEDAELHRGVQDGARLQRAEELEDRARILAGAFVSLMWMSLLHAPRYTLVLARSVRSANGQ